MHLLVLSAFRHISDDSWYEEWWFQCTFWCSVLSDGVYPDSRAGTLEFQCTFWCSVLSDLLTPIGRQVSATSFNAPSGAQCFPTRAPGVRRSFKTIRFQCTFWCSVLSDFVYKYFITHVDYAFQCTFWCSVLSDSAPKKPRHTAFYRNEIAADLESTTSNRPALVQLNHTTAKNRHKPPQRRRRPLPTGTPLTFNEPKPKNRPLTTTPR